MSDDLPRPSAQTYLDIADVRSPRIHRLYDYWRAQHQGDRLPRRADIHPEDIPHLLPYVLMIDLETSPFRVFYRLVGTKVAAYNKRDFSGHYLDEFTFPSGTAIADSYRAVVDSRRPRFGRGNLRSRIDSWVAFEYGLLPLSDDGRIVNKCLAIECYGDIDPDEIVEGLKTEKPDGR